MRKRIQQLASGKFEYARPVLQFSTDKVELMVLEGKDYIGDFVITSANRVPMRGVIYTSDPRMECLTPQFEGVEVRIRYQFHCNGLAEGDVKKGEFFIVCNQGEYNLSFVASISKLYADSSAGKVKNLGDFVRLAKESPEEAYRLFYSKNFKNIIKPEEKQELLCYRGLCGGTPTMQKMEEFLVGTERKKRVDLSIGTTEAEFYGVTETVREYVGVRRSEWGYLEVQVTSDAAFLEPGKSRLVEEDFLGSGCRFEYYIRAEELHAGKNYGCLRFEIPGRVATLRVCACNQEKNHLSGNTDHREIKECQMKLMKLYTDYRLKRIVTGVWTNRSVELLDHLMAMLPENELYPLMKAQTLIVNRQRQEASWIMEDFKRSCKDRERPIWGYYLYLCTLMEREPSYVDRITDEIEALFHKYPTSPLLFWVLLFVREEYYLNPSRRMEAIRSWIMWGNRSPFFYIEAYYMFRQDPYLLGRLDGFELDVLNWARKQGAITREMAVVVMSMVPSKREFNRFLYLVLEECYRIYPEDEMLSAICGYLIRSQQFSREYHSWFELGIEHELRITSLYEAYLMSLDGRQVESVPRMLQMYFQYNSNIAWQQRAVLFVNIIAGKDRQPEVYQKYRRTMEQFAMEQIEAGHISDNLAIIYDEMLQVGILNTELAHQMAGILFTHKLTCQDKRVARATIFQYQMKYPVSVPFVNGAAYFTAYTNDYCVILEDSLGNSFAGNAYCIDERIMQPERYLKICRELAPDDLAYVLYHFQKRRGWREFTERDAECFPVLLGSDEVSEAYKSWLIPEIIHYYHEREGMSAAEVTVNGSTFIETYLAKAQLERLETDARRYLINLLVESHMYDMAYNMVQTYGYDGVTASLRVPLCSYAITDSGYEEDDFLVGLAETTFLRGKYNDVLLLYLCKYYNGSTKNMAELWRAAGEFDIDTFDLEERILTQMLYTTEYIPYAEQIYENYYAGGGRNLVCMAYLSYYAYAYLVKDAVIPVQVFLQLESLYLQKKEWNDACGLGLLKYLAGKEELTGTKREIASQLLEEYTSRNLYFGFYRQFDKKLLMQLRLFDKYFLEVHETPGCRVSIHYRRDEEQTYREENLIEMYDGIYIKEFTLFFGEAVQYYITKEEESSVKAIESGCLRNNDMLSLEGQGKYALLNEMLLDQTTEEQERLKQIMKNYCSMELITEGVFKLIDG